MAREKLREIVENVLTDSGIEPEVAEELADSISEICDEEGIFENTSSINLDD